MAAVDEDAAANIRWHAEFGSERRPAFRPDPIRAVAVEFTGPIQLDPEAKLTLADTERECPDIDRNTFAQTGLEPIVKNLPEWGLSFQQSRVQMRSPHTGNTPTAKVVHQGYGLMTTESVS